MILGGVPTKVIIPPMLAAYANGISCRDAEIFAAAQIPNTTGIKQAVVPVLERTEDNPTPTIIIPNIKLFSPVPEIFTTEVPIFCARPV